MNKAEDKNTKDFIKKHKEAVIFYCNYEFKETPVNGVDQMTEQQLCELMNAYAEHTNKQI